jgi:3-phosphoshikimate 1-carboxyvinyltransferase
MNVAIEPGTPFRADVRVPADKSIAHRAFLCGAMAHGWTRIAGVPRSADVDATIRALGALGVQIQRNEDVAIVQGLGGDGLRCDGARIDCANSGTTMRLLLGVLANRDGTATLTGDASLSRRPMGRVAEPLRRMGASIDFSNEGFAPIAITGTTRLRGIDYELPIASAQVKTALIFAALGASGRTRLRGKLRSRDHTERMLGGFGAELTVSDEEIRIEGGQRLSGAFVAVPGDPSAAAPWIAAAILGTDNELVVPDVSLNPTRTGFIEVVRRMGATVDTVLRRALPEPMGSVGVKSSHLRGVTISEAEIPSIIDELPLIAVLATQAHGVTEVRGASELRVKESDRIAAMAGVLRAMGARIETFDDGFAVEGPQALRGAAVESHGDHRIAMAAAVAARAARGITTIHGAECVSISYPGFFEVWR